MSIRFISIARSSGENGKISIVGLIVWLFIFIIHALLSSSTDITFAIEELIIFGTTQAMFRFTLRLIILRFKLWSTNTNLSPSFKDNVVLDKPISL
jgi:hypothetical protein